MAAQPPGVHVTGVIFDIRTIVDAHALGSGATGGGATGGGVSEDAGKGRADAGVGVGGGGKSSGGADRGSAEGRRADAGGVKLPGRTIRTLCRLHYSGVGMGVFFHSNHRDRLEQQFLSLQASLAVDKATAPLASCLTPIFLPLTPSPPSAAAPTTTTATAAAVASTTIPPAAAESECPPPASTITASAATLPPLSLLWDPSTSCSTSPSPASPRFPQPTMLVALPGAAAGEVRVVAGPTAATLTSTPSPSPSPSSASPSHLQWHHSSLQGEALLPDMELLPALIARLSQEASGHVIIPYTMKWSRELDFLKRRAFPLLSSSPSPLPEAPGLLFSPLVLSQPLTDTNRPNQSSSYSQLPLTSPSRPSTVLHKATDEIVQVDATMGGVHLTFSPPFQHLLDHCSSSAGSINILDPLPAVLPLTDRVKTLSLLSDLLSQSTTTSDASQGFQSELPSAVLRVPRFVQVPDIRDTAAVVAAMAAAGVRLPVIVKPRIACGAAASHAMAIVFSADAFATLALPSPSVIQEYVDHGACQFKCYVLGEAFFAAERRSTPDAAPLLQQQGETQQQQPQGGGASEAPAAISFDSLKSLPMAFPSQPSATPQPPLQQQQGVTKPGIPSGAAQEGKSPLGAAFNEGAACHAADLLRTALGLTLFGFDILVQKGTGEHVIVDVNYFPSFKDVPDHLAIPAFWAACASRIV
ncbi:hypothetical protein CLOM_g8811 [Closterium sp. NIES-68]|nr:hypothetical protein CLOM_g8811 [Closterium sp. NIES-68]GJP60043.1 hypothetical protein CLOP_g17185 [Closterium sp. NIES-67]